MAFTRPKAAQIDFDITNITDPLIRLNSGETGSADKDVGIVVERGSDTNTAIIWDESTDSFAVINTTEDGSTSGNVTISSYADLTLKKITQSEQQYTTSNMMKFNQIYTGASAGSYFTQNEYQKILTITPSADSQNYQISGRIMAQSAGSIQIVHFNAALRSETLPALAYSVTYTDQHNGTAFVKPQLWHKQTTTAGFVIAFQYIHNANLFGTVTVDIDVIPRTSDQKSNVVINTTQNSETTTVDTGFTAVDMTKIVEIDGDNFNIAAHDGSADGLELAGTLVTATAAELNYVDGVTSNIQTQLDAKLALAGGTMSGAIAMGTNKITGMGDPTANQDAATKAYVDTQTSSIVTTTDIAGDTGTDTVTLGSDTLTFSGTANEITTAVTDNTVTISLPDDVTIGSDLTVTGNLTVNGTTTTISTTNSVVSDSLIELNTGASSNSNDLGIVMERGSTGDNAIIAWDESADKFIVGTTTATGASTGDLTITTGTLVANVEGNVTGNLTGDVTGNADTATALATARNIAGNSFNGTGDITIASTDLSDTSNLVRNNQNNTITSTTAGSSAAPEFELFRDITGADANYIGQIKFSADNDADQKTVFAKITGKIGDASDGSEDGIIEIAHQKAGSNNINVRMTSTEFKIMNGTDFDVETHDGSSTGLRLANTLVTATAAELNYVDGVTSNIQTQLDAKAPTAGPTFTGTLTYATLNDGTTALTSTVAELNILDGVTSTAAELNILDGDTAATSTTLVDADRFVVNDAGTMVQVAASDVATYIGAASSVFKTISVSGQSDVVADSNTDTLTLAEGTGVTITTNASTDTITFTVDSGTSVFSSDNDLGNVADSAGTTEDLGNVADSHTTSQDLGTITVQGIVVTGSIIDGNVTTAKLADDAVTGVKLSGLTDSSNGFIQADGDGTFSIGTPAAASITDGTSTLDFNGSNQVQSDASIVPNANGTLDLGTSALRWQNIYTSDLNLSNGVGDYTVVEGEEDLFLYNNKSGKVFKFALIEVDPSEATPKIEDLKNGSNR